GLSFEMLEPRSFSFNTPYGACETCAGLGSRLEVDADLVVGDQGLSLEEGVLLPWGTGSQSNYYKNLLASVSTHLGIAQGTPWRHIPKSIRRQLLYGLDGQERVQVDYTNRYG